MQNIEKKVNELIEKMTEQLIEQLEKSRTIDDAFCDGVDALKKLLDLKASGVI